MTEPKNVSDNPTTSVKAYDSNEDDYDAIPLKDIIAREKKAEDEQRMILIDGLYDEGAEHY